MYSGHLQDCIYVDRHRPSRADVDDVWVLYVVAQCPLPSKYQQRILAVVQCYVRGCVARPSPRAFGRELENTPRQRLCARGQGCGWVSRSATTLYIRMPLPVSSTCIS